MKNQNNRIARLEKEKPSMDQAWSVEMFEKWGKDIEEKYGKTKTTPEEREKINLLFSHIDSTSN